jgi:phospholipid/cholesterol/gamma-HCH transport system substrate-binding protein
MNGKEINMDYKTFKSIEFKVGLFVIITILSIVMTMGYVAYKKDIFAKTYNYKLISKSG